MLQTRHALVDWKFSRFPIRAWSPHQRPEQNKNILDEDQDQCRLGPSESDGFHITHTMLQSILRPARIALRVVASNRAFYDRVMLALLDGALFNTLFDRLPLGLVGLQAIENRPGPLEQGTNRHDGGKRKKHTASSIHDQHPALIKYKDRSRMLGWSSPEKNTRESHADCNRAGQTSLIRRMQDRAGDDRAIFPSGQHSLHRGPSQNGTAPATRSNQMPVRSYLVPLAPDGVSWLGDPSLSSFGFARLPLLGIPEISAVGR